MIELAALLVGFAIGAIVGIFGVIRWYVWRTMQPGVARDILRSLYKNAHPHWLQAGPSDSRRVCPCCGWTDDSHVQ